MSSPYGEIAPPTGERTYLLSNVVGTSNANELGALFLDWRSLIVRGVISILFSITAFCMPGATVQAFLWLFAGTLVFVGSVMISGGLIYCQGLPFILGSVEFLIGALAFMYQGLTAVILLYMVAFRMIFAGTMFMAIAWQGRSHHDTPADLGVSLGLSGFIFMLAGFSLLAVHPVEGILALVWVVAAQALVDGLVSFYAAYRVKTMELDTSAAPLAVENA